MDQGGLVWLFILIRPASNGNFQPQSNQLELGFELRFPALIDFQLESSLKGSVHSLLISTCFLCVKRNLNFYVNLNFLFCL